MAEYSGELERFNSSASNRQRASALTESLDPARPTNVVHKITSESPRLTIEPQTGQARSLSSNNLEPNKQKKSSSFQITSVTVSSSVSNDGEDDSCGEVETEPSEAGGSRNFNELEVEMFEREDESDSTNVTNNIDSAPVSTTHHNYTQQVNHSEAGAIVGGLKLEDKDQQALQQRRFRVVKIESSEPFKRGRWLCMDFLDHPSIQQSISTREEPASSHSSSGSLTENLHVEDLTISNVTVQPNNIPLQTVSSSAVLNPSSQPQLQQQQPPSQSSIHQVAHSLPASAASINYPTVAPAVQQHQPLYQQQQPQSSVPVYPVASMASLTAVVSNPTSLAMPIIVSQSAGPALPATVGAVPSQTFIQHPSVSGLLHGNQQPPVAATVVPVVPVQPIFTAPTNVQPQQQYVPTSLQGGIQTAMAGTPQQSLPQLTPATVPATQVPLLAQQQTGLIQQPSLSTGAATVGVTSGLAPSSSIHPVVVMKPATAMTVPLAPVGQPPPSSSSQTGVGLQQPTLVAQQQSSIPPIQQQPNLSHTSVPGSMTVLQGPPLAAFDVNQQQPHTQPNHLIHQQAVPSTTVSVASQPLASNSEPAQLSIQPQQQTQQQVHHIQQPVIQQQQQATVAPVHSHIPQQTVVPPPVLVQQPTQSSSTVPIVLPVYTSAQVPSVHPMASSVVVSHTTATVTATSALGGAGGGGVLGAVGSAVEKDGPDTHAGEELASAAGGSSTVAIDNKIEQAMDLVKSHLMFAVREEVEVLKERIAELEERIAFLESENAILRSTATQDALAQIAHLETTFNPTGSMADAGNAIVATASAAGPVVIPGSSINISVASTATNTVPNASSTQPVNGAPPAAP